MKDRRKILIAIALSVLLHLLFVGSVVVISIFLPKQPPIAPAKPAKPLEITLAQSTPTPKPTPPPTLKKPNHPRLPHSDVILSDGLQKTNEVNKNAEFESDTNLKAGSELPAMGSIPLPSQKARNLPFAQFDNSDYSAGKNIASENASQKPTTQNPREESPAKAQVKPEAKPQTTKATATPTATATPKPTPPPQADRLFALGKPTPIPVPESQRPPQVPQPMLRQSQPQPRSPSNHLENIKTEIAGNVSQPGKNGVDAVQTLRGVYERIIKARLDSSWNIYGQSFRDQMTIGEAHFQFKIDAQGKVVDLHLLYNSSNETFASVCVKAIKAHDFPPPNPAILENGLYEEQDYGFGFYPP